MSGSILDMVPPLIHYEPTGRICCPRCLWAITIAFFWFEILCFLDILGRRINIQSLIIHVKRLEHKIQVPLLRSPYFVSGHLWK